MHKFAIVKSLWSRRLQMEGTGRWQVADGRDWPIQLKLASEVHCTMEIGIKMSDFLGIIDEECHNWRRKKVILNKKKHFTLNFKVFTFLQPWPFRYHLPTLGLYVLLANLGPLGKLFHFGPGYLGSLVNLFIPWITR